MNEYVEAWCKVSEVIANNENIDFSKYKNYLHLLGELADKSDPEMPILTAHTKRCPYCNRALSGNKNSHVNNKYCPRCGQAIDWGE